MDKFRRKGVGKLMAACFLKFARDLGYKVLHTQNIPGNHDGLPYARCVCLFLCIRALVLRFLDLTCVCCPVQASYFNLVFANNPASIALWESLRFKRVAHIPKCARLKGVEVCAPRPHLFGFQESRILPPLNCDSLNADPGPRRRLRVPLRSRGSVT